MPEADVAHFEAARNSSQIAAPVQSAGTSGAAGGNASLRDIARVLLHRRRWVISIIGGLQLACLLYCAIAAKQYQAQARIELRTAPASTLTLRAADAPLSASILSAPVQLETVAGVFHGEKLEWRVIDSLKLYQQPAFAGNFARRFPGFRADAPSTQSRAWLLQRFDKHLQVETVPHTLLIGIRFRCRDAQLSASVVNGLIAAYMEEERESQLEATARASGWLQQQLASLKTRVARDEERLAEYESVHGILTSPAMPGDDPSAEHDHNSTLLQVDEMSRQLVAATSDRILREAEFRAASQGDPELVLATDPGLQTGESVVAVSLLQQIHSRRSALEQEQAQLSAEHGTDFPRVIEIQRELLDLDRQQKAQDAQLVQRFRSAWQTSADREGLVRKNLGSLTGQGASMNVATARYQDMREEAESSHALYMQVLAKVEEAGLAAGVQSSNIAVVNSALPPTRPYSPNLPLYMAITFFVSLWLALVAALLADRLPSSALRTAVALLMVCAATMPGRAQAPTPSTSGLPTGVASFPQTPERKSAPNAQESPPLWNQPAPGMPASTPASPVAQFSAALPAPIAPGDSLDVSEYHTPEFRSQVRVSPDGAVMLPLIGEVHIAGLEEQSAARVIEKALLDKHMLLHPMVSVTVTVFAGQDVSVLGEVARPGIYPYALHHRLLDVISAASGLSPNAGRLVNVFHRDDPKTPHAFVLDPTGADAAGEHNPELSSGDTVEVSRAGLVYVIGAVVRPGGFPVDPVQGLTVVQALSLAWGPTQVAAASKALLIREQNGGRTTTSLDLKRMLRGKEPDLTIRDRDILFVPDSTAKNLWNRTMESAIQSTIGVTIYSGLVYSQRY